jgi:hypothetical protein
LRATRCARSGPPANVETVGRFDFREARPRDDHARQRVARLAAVPVGAVDAVDDGTREVVDVGRLAGGDRREQRLGRGVDHVEVPWPCGATQAPLT